MREIKFRFWAVDKYDVGYQMIYDYTFYEVIPVNDMLNSPDVTAMQYTGLQDKDGKEVYEGDILKGYGYGNLSGKYVVKFVEGEWKAIAINNLTFSLPAKYFEHAELIGNVFENPELI